MRYNKSSQIRYYIILHLIIALYSIISVLSKFAAREEFLSWGYIFFYGAVIVALLLYAVVWQQVLKKVDLNVAYASKAVTVIWSTLWGVIIFSETLSWNNIVGGLIVLSGVILMVTGGEKKNG